MIQYMSLCFVFQLVSRSTNSNTKSSSSSSSCSMPLLQRRHFHDFAPLFTVKSSVPGRPQSQVLLFEVILDDASHVWWGRARGRLHSVGGSLMPALRARVWSSSESEWMMWPKNLRRLSMTAWVTGGWAERMQTSWLVTRVVKRTRRMYRRHHWSNALSRLLDLTVMSHISEPYSKTSRA